MKVEGYGGNRATIPTYLWSKWIIISTTIWQILKGAIYTPTRRRGKDDKIFARDRHAYLVAETTPQDREDLASAGTNSYRVGTTSENTDWAVSVVGQCREGDFLAPSDAKVCDYYRLHLQPPPPSPSVVWPSDMRGGNRLTLDIQCKRKVQRKLWFATSR